MSGAIIKRLGVAKQKNTCFVTTVTIQSNKCSICRYILFSRHKMATQEK